MKKQRLKKAHEITDAKIQFVSLVDRAANLKTFLVKKEHDGRASFTTQGRIIKADAETHYVTGVVYEPMVEDAHGDFMTADEITKAAYWFAKNGNKVDLQHSFEPLQNAAVVESWVAKEDCTIEGETIAKGTWLMTVEVNDPEIWARIEKGEITGFSMGGTGIYSEEDVDLESVTKESSEKIGLLKKLGNALGVKVVEKGKYVETYQERSKYDLFWVAFDTLEELLRHYNEYTGRVEFESDEDNLRDALTEFSEVITGILASDQPIAKSIAESRASTKVESIDEIAKAGKKMSAKNKETLTGIYESLGRFLKEFDEPEPDEEEGETEKKAGTEEPEGEEKPEEKKEVTKEMTRQEVTELLQEQVTAAVSKALEAQNAAEDVQKGAEEQEQITKEEISKMIEEAVQKAVEPLKKATGVPSNMNDVNGAGVQKNAETHYLHGIL